MLPLKTGGITAYTLQTAKNSSRVIREEFFHVREITP